MKLTMKSLLLIPVLAVLAACGGGGGDDSPSTPATPVLRSIDLSPGNPTIAVGTTVQLTATGTYSDGKTAVLKDNISWTVKGSNATVATSGLVTGKAVGTDNIVATVSGVSGNTNVNITAPWDGVAAGGVQTLALKRDGTIWGFGSNQWGQLGDGSTTSQNKPVLASGGVTTWKQVASGELHTVALKADGTLWAWGFNQNGQLGIGTNADFKPVPTQVGAAKDWVFVAAGKAHTLAINKSGILYAWGRNFDGQLGDGTNVDKLVPTKIGTFTNWKTVAAGATHSLGVRSGDNSLYAWGGNDSGQLGNGGLVDLLVPTKIGASTWVTVAAGGTHSLAIRTDGALFAWGGNASGQLGNDSSTNATAPVQITADINWANISAGANHSLAVKSDGTLWSWGSNSDGQLGVGTVSDAASPTQVGKTAIWKAVSAGQQHSFGVQTDGTMWGWGRAAEGPQGNGTVSTSGVLVPTAVP